MDADVLRDFCREKIAHHKIPRYVNVVMEFPMTITGKVRKVVMREQSIVLLGLEDEGAGPTAQG
jgi:fatty-acyl-CoA synthase